MKTKNSPAFSSKKAHKAVNMTNESEHDISDYSYQPKSTNTQNHQRSISRKRQELSDARLMAGGKAS